MKIEINGKTLLALSLLSASIAFGDFVKSSEINVVSGASEEEIAAAVNAKFEQVNPIGSVLFRMDSVNPSTLYGGTWELITGDASVRLGNGSNLSNSLVGENEPLVPVVEHTHNATQEAHSHTRGSMNITGQFGNGFYGEYSSTGTKGAFTRSSSKGATKYTQEGWVTNGPLIDFNANKAWTGSTDSKSPSITVESTGEASATIDVRGQYVLVNVWRRVS